MPRVWKASSPIRSSGSWPTSRGTIKRKRRSCDRSAAVVLMMAMGTPWWKTNNQRGWRDSDNSNLWVSPASGPPAGFNWKGVAGFDRISGRLHGKAHTDRGI